MTPTERRAAGTPRRAPRFALGIDIGTTNTKAVLVSITDDPFDGERVQERAVRSFRTPPHADAIVSGLEDSIRAVVAEGGAQPSVVGIASMAETCVPLDARRRPLRELVRWNGQADTLGMELLTKRATPEALFDLTGVPLAPKVPLAIWAALAEAHPALWMRIVKWAGPADYVGLALTGNLVTDHTLAGRTMGYRLPAAGQPLPRSFDARLLGLAGLRTDHLPDVAVPGEAAGSITDSATRRFGLERGIPVYIAGHDHAVGAWAAGVRQPGDVADSMGTAEALVAVLAGQVDRREVGRAGMSLTRTSDGTRESLLSGTPHAGALVSSWFETTLRGWDRDALFEEVTALPPGPGEVLVLPYPSGRQTPAPDPEARLAVVNHRGEPVDPHRVHPAELTRALLEGLALHLRWMAAEQARLAGQGEPNMLRVLGGAGATNSAWLAIKAAIMPGALETVSVAEPVASGAALLAAHRAGLVDADVRLPISPRPVPPGHPSSYDTAYAAFVAAAAGATAGKGTQ